MTRVWQLTVYAIVARGVVTKSARLQLVCSGYQRRSNSLDKASRRRVEFEPCPANRLSSARGLTLRDLATLPSFRDLRMVSRLHFVEPFATCE